MDVLTPELLFENPRAWPSCCETAQKHCWPPYSQPHSLPCFCPPGDEEQGRLPKTTFPHKWSFTGDFSLAHSASSTWGMDCFQVENMLNFLIKKFAAQGLAGIVPPSTHTTLTCQSPGAWVILGALAPWSVWCSWAVRSSLPCAVGCTSQASPAVLPQPTAQPPR